MFLCVNRKKTVRDQFTVPGWYSCEEHISFSLFAFGKAHPHCDAMTLNSRQGGLVNFLLDSPFLEDSLFHFSISF